MFTIDTSPFPPSVDEPKPGPFGTGQTTASDNRPIYDETGTRREYVIDPVTNQKKYLT